MDDTNKTNRIDVLLATNSMVDEGNGHIRFNNGLTLSDESEQKNGTSYEIDSMNIEEYSGDVFLDHDYNIESLVGKAYGIAKQGGRLIAEGIKFAIDENPKANLLYKMVRSGYARAVSIGTQGPLDEDGIYRNARLLEFSFVGIGNNDNAVINSAEVYGDNYTNAIERAEANGLDMEGLKETINIKDNKMSEITKNDVATEETVEKTDDATVEQNSKMAEMEAKLAKFEDMIANAQSGSAIEGEVLDSTFNAKNAISEKIANMSSKERTKAQINAIWKNRKGMMDAEANELFYAINEANKQDILKSKYGKNIAVAQNDLPVLGMGEDSGFGHWVPCVDYFEEVETCKTDYDVITNRFGFDSQDTCFYAWSLVSANVDMQPVSKCDDGENGNLKPITGEFDNAPQLRQMIEMAGVTPVCNAATIFLAGNMLEKIAREYAYDYRRKQAEFVVGAIQQAIDAHVAGITGVNGTPIVPANADASLAWDGTAGTIIDLIKQLCGCCPNGVLLMSCASKYQLAQLCADCGDGYAFGTNFLQTGNTGNILGKTVIEVPNDLMPELGSGATTTVGGVDPLTGQATTVTVNHAVVYIDPTSWKGVTNGGFRYDLRGDVAYELPDGTVRSAYQRDELVARGYFFIGGGFTDPSCAVGIQS